MHFHNSICSTIVADIIRYVEVLGRNVKVCFYPLGGIKVAVTLTKTSSGKQWNKFGEL